MQQQINSDSDSNSEYITSYIGRSTPIVRGRGSEGVKRVGVDSGQGESSDEGSSSDSDSETSHVTLGPAVAEVCDNSIIHCLADFE